MTHIERTQRTEPRQPDVQTFDGQRLNLDEEERPHKIFSPDNRARYGVRKTPEAPHHDFPGTINPLDLHLANRNGYFERPIWSKPPTESQAALASNMDRRLSQPRLPVQEVPRDVVSEQVHEPVEPASGQERSGDGPKRSSDEAPAPGHDRRTWEEILALPKQDRLRLSKEERFGYTSIGVEGRKTGMFVSAEGNIGHYDKKREISRKSKKIAEDLRTYFNNHHGYDIPKIRRRDDGSLQRFRSIVKVLEEAKQQNEQARQRAQALDLPPHEWPRDLSSLINNRKKAIENAAAYARSREEGQDYVSDEE